MTQVGDQKKDTASTHEKPRHRQILQETGPAAGRITGINHLVLFTHDMNESVRFYRDLLGLRVVRTMRFSPTADGLRTAAHHSSGHAVGTTSEPAQTPMTSKVRQVFFQMGNSELFSLYESPDISKRPAAPISTVLWPAIEDGRISDARENQKFDHLSFDVPTHEDVVWFQEHLLTNGVAVSDVSERRGKDNAHRFISSIYFYDPSGNPLEISSMNMADKEWQSYDFSTWFFDEDPVPSLLDDASGNSQTLVPNWARPSAK
jgi:catechol 2,3-dioxygenase-like lactoylglutathione lyase family enzyme